MSTSHRWKADAFDPLPQLLDEHPGFAEPDHLVAFSQSAALAHWPDILRWSGPCSIILRRMRSEGAEEWRDQLALLRHMLDQANEALKLHALTDAAAAELSGELGLPVAALPKLARCHHGDRTLALSQSAELVLRRDTATQPMRHYNLGRLRRVAKLNADGTSLDTADLAAFANGAPDGVTQAVSTKPVVVIVVPNGFGLGHVTRMLAVAQQLRARKNARVIFWSFSRAAGIVVQYGFEVVSRQTANHLGADHKDWQTWETEEFAAVLAKLKPALVVEDSAILDRFVIDALARHGSGSARLALVRRGMWQTHILGPDLLRSEQWADLVIEPADLASPADRGLTRGRAGKTDAFAKLERSAPVTLTSPTEMLDRRRARSALGLGRGRHCLVSLGGQAYGDWHQFVRQLVDQAKKRRTKLVWARSPLAGPDPDLDDNTAIQVRDTYPIAPYLAAFDGVVSAAGYNSFHELMQLFDGPVLFVPRQHTALDDQAARAGFAAAQGWAFEDSRPGTAGRSIAEFLAAAQSGDRNTARPQWQDGAAEIATSLIALIEAGDLAE